MSMRSAAAVVLVAIAGLGCREARAPSGPVEPPPARALPNGLHWMRNAAEYRALTRQVFRDAARVLPARVSGLAEGRWAVAVDADETLLDNSPYQKQLAQAGFAFSQSSWHEWCRRREAGAIPGAVEFLAEVRRLRGKIVVVTNRSTEVQEDTEANLSALGLPYDKVLCRPADSPGDKQPRWDAVEAGTADPSLPALPIVMWIGDNIGDFPGQSQDQRDAGAEAFADFGERFFVLPNPVYGSWEQNPRQ